MSTDHQTATPPERRPARPQTVLTVLDQRWLSPVMVRIEAGGPGAAALAPDGFTDTYAKIPFVDPALGLAPPYDVAALNAALPSHQRPVTRTYTLRAIRADTVTVDFVVHGAAGVAGPWAAAAGPGDTLVLAGAGGGFRPDPATGWHVFLGDESALPAIGRALDALPRDARGEAHLETCDREHHLPADPPDGIRINWIDRDRPGTAPTALAEAVTGAARPPDGPVAVFAHGERESMKAVRAALKALDLPATSLSGYWAHGRAEEVFQAEKRQPIGRIGD